MTATLVELAGFFLVVIGVGLVVGAAYLVSLPLALLAAGVFTVFLGIAAIIVVNNRKVTP